MYNARTNIFFLTDISLQKRILIEKLRCKFSIPCNGLAIAFDNRDYPEFQNEKWRSDGLHINIEKGDMELEQQEGVPNSVAFIIESKNYANLIWITHKCCIESDAQFTGLMSHELQHYMQDRISYTLSQINGFMLNYFLKLFEPKTKMDIPYEFDAELKAFKIVKEWFGIEEAKAYIIKGENKKLLGKFLNYNFDISYDLLNETILLYEKYRDQLLKYSETEQFYLDDKIQKIKKMIRPLMVYF